MHLRTVGARFPDLQRTGARKIPSVARTKRLTPRVRCRLYSSSAIVSPETLKAMLAINNTDGLLSSCLGMLCASLIGGALPRFLHRSSAMEQVGCLGAGLLIGTALCVILPEGFEALHNAEVDAASSIPEWLPHGTLLIGFLAMLLLDLASHSAFGDDATHIQHAQLPHASHGHAHASPPAEPGNSVVGTSDLEEALLPSDVPPPALTPPRTTQPSVSPMLYRTAQQPTRSSPVALENSPGTHSAAEASGIQVLSGLLVHSAADGIAVGAAAMSSSTAVSLTVAIAMVMHKAPVAFGLSSFLLTKSRWSWRQVVQGVVAFSLAAPLLALATWATLQAFPVGGSASTTAALALLFSGGTFLYASCIHVLPAVMHSPGKGASTTAQLTMIITGCFLPLLLSSLFPHHD